MSTLKKGDLVMTEHGLGLYGYLRTGGATHRVDLFDGREDVLCEKAEPKTRAKVEAYLKEKGWEKIVNYNWVSRSNQYFIQPTVDSGYRVKLDGSHYENSFETAPEQLAEAILMARLLNAVK